MEWITQAEPVDYPAALLRMQARVEALRRGEGRELGWLLEHPPLYTAGTSARRGDLLAAQSLPVYETGRGGQYTYHGPGQRVAYLMLDLKQRDRDVRAYVRALEQWIIGTLARFNVEGFTREGRIGVWVDVGAERGKRNGSAQPPHNEAKIAALGVRVQGWVTSHGIALNVAPNLQHYQGIIPCGIREYGVTSLQAIGVNVGMDAVDQALRAEFPRHFKPSATA